MKPLERRSKLLSLTKVAVASLGVTFVASFGISFKFFSGLAPARTDLTSLFFLLIFVIIFGFIDYFASKRTFLYCVLAPFLVLFIPFATYGLVLCYGSIVVGLSFFGLDLVRKLQNRKIILNVLLAASLMGIIILFPRAYSDLSTVSHVEDAYDREVILPIISNEEESVETRINQLIAVPSGCESISATQLRQNCEKYVSDEKAQTKWDLGIQMKTPDPNAIKLACSGHWDPNCEDDMKAIIVNLHH